MRALQSTAEEPQADVIAADLADRIAALFSRWPILDGFSVQERSSLTQDRVNANLDAALCVADVAVRTWPGYDASAALYEEITEAMLELLDERPEACDLLRGTTFARALH